MVASWNVRTLQDTGLGARRRTALIACELARYNIEIAALSETRLTSNNTGQHYVKDYRTVYFSSVCIMLYFEF